MGSRVLSRRSKCASPTSPHALLHYQCRLPRQQRALSVHRPIRRSSRAQEQKDCSEKRLDKFEAYRAYPGRTFGTPHCFRLRRCRSRLATDIRTDPNPAQQRRRTFTVLLNHFETSPARNQSCCYSRMASGPMPPPLISSIWQSSGYVNYRSLPSFTG